MREFFFLIYLFNTYNLLQRKSDGEHESSRRLKTQFLIEMEGFDSGNDQVLLIGNCWANRLKFFTFPFNTLIFSLVTVSLVILLMGRHQITVTFVKQYLWINLSKMWSSM